MANLQLNGNEIFLIGKYAYKIKETMYLKHRFLIYKLKVNESIKT